MGLLSGIIGLLSKSLGVIVQGSSLVGVVYCLSANLLLIVVFLVLSSRVHLWWFMDSNLHCLLTFSCKICKYPLLVTL